MNPIEIYTDAGRKAGLAAKRKDMGLLRHWNDWLSRALALENPDRRKTFARPWALDCAGGDKVISIIIFAPVWLTARYTHGMAWL